MACLWDAREGRDWLAPEGIASCLLHTPQLRGNESWHALSLKGKEAFCTCLLKASHRPCSSEENSIKCRTMYPCVCMWPVHACVLTQHGSVLLYCQNAFLLGILSILPLFIVKSARLIITKQKLPVPIISLWRWNLMQIFVSSLASLENIILLSENSFPHLW